MVRNKKRLESRKERKPIVEVEEEERQEKIWVNYNQSSLMSVNLEV